MQLRHAARTDAGKTRDHNEDSYGMEVGGERAAAGALFVVCDGIGGYDAGEVASDLAVKTIIASYYARAARGIEAALDAAFQEANDKVFRARGGKMGTTSVAAVFKDDVVVIANVGDCRAYLVRNGQARQLSKDHSFVAEQVAAGMLTEDQARESSYRNIITRAIGNRADIEVDLFREPVLQNDVIVLCSDGLHGQVEADEMALAVTKVSLEQACNSLVRLANDRGGPDNITIIAVQVAELTFSAASAPDRAGDRRNSTAKTARLVAPTAAAPAAETTSQPPVSDPPHGVERRSGGDRRSAQRAAVMPPQATPAPGGGRIRSFVLWMIALALIAALLLGAYYAVYLRGSAAAQPPAVPAVPTLTPLVAPTTTPAASGASAPTPTLISSPAGTTTSSP